MVQSRSFESTKLRSNAARLIACAVALMIFGLAIHWKFETWASDTSSPTQLQGWTYVAAVPLIAGGILAFLGSVRMSLIARPLHLMLAGLFLVIVAFGGPVLAARVVPVLKNYPWTGAAQIPIWVCDLAGLLFVSTGLLRFLSERTGTSR